MNTSEYARLELQYLLNSPVRTDHIIANQIVEICEIFDQQYNSEASAQFEIKALLRILQRKPITPLTGEEDEWEYHPDGTAQNKRCAQIFKDEYGNAYDSKAVQFSDDGHTWYYSTESKEYIQFPYVVPNESKKVIRNKKAIKAIKPGEPLAEDTQKVPVRISTKNVLDHQGRTYENLAQMCKAHEVSYAKVYRLVSEKGVTPKDAVLHIMHGGTVKDYAYPKRL